MIIYDAIIIGGGVIGLYTLRSSLLAGYNTILIERNPHLCNGASGRNSGILCTGVVHHMVHWNEHLLEIRYRMLESFVR